MKNAITAIHFPRASRLDQPSRERAQGWLEYAKAAAHGGLDYFEDTLRGKLKHELSVYEAARLCHPLRTLQIKWGVTHLQKVLLNADLLRQAPFLKSFSLALLTDELPQYVKAVESLELRDEPFTSQDIMPFWKLHATNLPTWSKLARVFATLSTSSAAAERAFSILSNSFSKRQTAALEDYVSLSVMLQYNRSRLRGDESLAEVSAHTEQEAGSIAETAELIP